MYNNLRWSRFIKTVPFAGSFLKYLLFKNSQFYQFNWRRRPKHMLRYSHNELPHASTITNEKSSYFFQKNERKVIFSNCLALLFDPIFKWDMRWRLQFIPNALWGLLSIYKKITYKWKRMLTTRFLFGY